jgi:hypothetical protein
MRSACIRFAATLGLLGLLAAPLGADPLSDVRNPFAGSGPYDAMCAPMNKDCEFHNFWHMYQKSENVKRLLYGYERMGTAAQGGGQALVLRVKADPSADAVPQIAQASQRDFPGASVPAIVGFMHGRILDYEKTVTDEGLAPESLPVSCDYLAESLYQVGSGLQVDGGTARLNIRATCVVLLAGLEQSGHLQDNAHRQALLEYLVVLGGTYRARDAMDVARHNYVLRSINAANARRAFREIFNADEASLPPEQFPCVLAGKAASCSDILRQTPQFAPKLVASFP